MSLARSAFRLLLIAGIALAGVARAQVAVIVNPKSSINNLTPEQISALFLGKTNALPGGIAQPVDLPDSSPIRDQFYSKATGRSGAQVKAAWARLAFSGKATPPKEVLSSSDVKRLVAANPEAIGYIEKAAADGSVKVLLVLE